VEARTRPPGSRYFPESLVWYFLQVSREDMVTRLPMDQERSSRPGYPRGMSYLGTPHHFTRRALIHNTGCPTKKGYPSCQAVEAVLVMVKLIAPPRTFRSCWKEVLWVLAQSAAVSALVRWWNVHSVREGRVNINSELYRFHRCGLCRMQGLRLDHQSQMRRAW
jgi:hypothetical protein